ncbi:adenylate/guanylate cyclase domain-containing protein [Peterkaempfera bronchialis]|uniref:Adenylate/guanylate cyclase domain-containing protein n=1 Tax=Peterkaempfera bronchialis TaxID=2126346 RepID=A0A345SVW2_9ACTN|nr:adenylate/guanylate cyclase domain-containing protein [Peterkaempfera bronchialis]
MTDDDGISQERLPDHDPADPAGLQHQQQDDESTVSLKLEQLILDAPRKYTPYQAARTAGVPMELASRFWRAMGFPDIGQSRALTDADVIALRRLAGMVEAGLLSESMAIQVARSTGQTTARLAEWQMDTFLENLTQSLEPGLSRADVAYPLVQLLLPELEEFLVYVWRRQLAAVTGRVVQAADDAEITSGRLAVGFADLVGFTRLSRRLEEEELGELVETFESTCADLVAGHGGRLIKTLGDEILYVSDDPAVAAEIGLALVETLTKDDSMPALRVGMAFGTVTSRMGDVFGTTVNLASRLTSIAPKDAVLIDGEFAAALERERVVPPTAPPGEGGAEAAAAPTAPGGSGQAEAAPEYRFHLQPMWRRPVRGLGLVEPWLLARRLEHG